MPWSRKPRLGIEQAHRNFVLACGLMYGQPQVIWERLFDSCSKGLVEKDSVSGE